MGASVITAGFDAARGATRDRVAVHAASNFADVLVSEPRALGVSSTVISPPGLALGSVAAALDAAGIAHRAGGFPRGADVAAEPNPIYLIEEPRLLSLGTRDTVEAALAVIAAGGRATTIVIAEPGSTNEWLARNPHVGGWLIAPLDPAAVVATVRTAAMALAARTRAETLREESDRLLRIGVALSSERDLTKLHGSIVRGARELTQADSGSLFLLEGEGAQRALRFAVAQTGPQDAGTHVGAVLPLSQTSISGYVALSGETVRIEDAYAIGEDAVYRFNPSFDKANGYRTKSVLAVPMRDHESTIVGVIMLINRKPHFDDVLASPADAEAAVLPFDDRDERVLLSLASQAAVALENKALLDSIQDLFEQFVRASVMAIEVRDRATQGHSARVADFTVRQAEAVNAVEAGIFADLHFDADALREVRYAALLHDFGKVAVPEYIFGKSKKLPDGRLDTVRLRFYLALEQATTDAQRDELLALLAQIEGANEPRVVDEGAEATLAAAAARTYRELGELRPLLTPEELEFLRIPRGSLSADERRRMEQHVTQSFAFLREIPWQKTPWRNVADLAYGHHELLDGSGYPRGLRSDAIVPQIRMLTISDVFDALTANDRPYKPAMPVERALDILTKEFAERGKVDRDLLDLFITKKLYVGSA
jgi:HD-GYP domain-containing protein (c-di-GMP phosphodiesterase class II)